jgi:hypothetical protein
MKRYVLPAFFLLAAVMFLAGCLLTNQPSSSVPPVPAAATPTLSVSTGTPTTDSQIYTGAFPVYYNGTPIKAIAVLSTLKSNVAAATFTF